MSPYKVRPLNWNLLLQPTMEGLNTEAQSSSRLGAMIAAGGGEVGQGFKNKRTEAESKRRFDLENARQDRELSLRETMQKDNLQLKRDALTEKERERQANQTSLLDMVETTTQMALGGDPTALEVLPEAANALGGPENAQRMIANRGGMGGGNLTAVPVEEDATAFHDRLAKEAPLSAPSSGPVEIPPVGAPAKSPAPAAPMGGAGGATSPTPALAAPAMNPSVGESGVADLPSEELAVKVENAKQRIELAKKAMDTARAALRPNGLTSSADRAKATKAYNDAMTAYISAGKDQASFTRRLTQAAKREATAATVEMKRAEANDKAIETARGHADTLIAWSADPEGARKRLSQANLSDPTTRSRIAVEYERQKAEHTAAAQARAAKEFTPEYRHELARRIEADPDSGISDADGMTDAELDREDKAVAKRAEARQRQMNTLRDDNRADNSAANKKERDKELDAVKRENADRRRQSALEKQIAKWDAEGDGNGATFAPGTPEHSAYWKAKGELDAINARLEAGESGAPVDDYPGVGDREKWNTLTPEQKKAALKALGR